MDSNPDVPNLGLKLSCSDNYTLGTLGTPGTFASQSISGTKSRLVRIFNAEIVLILGAGERVGEGSTKFEARKPDRIGHTTDLVPAHRQLVQHTDWLPRNLISVKLAEAPILVET